MISYHYSEEREHRENVIHRIGSGKPVISFIVDRGHKNGAERHVITDNAIIIIYNARTNKLVTKLIARPNQIKRYYESVGKTAPQKLLDLAYQHVKAGYNN